MRNVMGRENVITCGRTNELAHAVRTEYSCDSLMADRMGLDGTMLHYLAVRKAMVSVHKPVHSKITLTYSLTWQADRCSLVPRPLPDFISQPWRKVGLRDKIWEWPGDEAMTAVLPGEWLSRRY